MRITVIGRDTEHTTDRDAIRYLAASGHELHTEPDDGAELVIVLADAADMPLLLATARSSCTVPVLAFTEEESEQERVIALRAGADDCVSPAIGFAELDARIDALTRRCAPRNDDSTWLDIEELSIHVDDHVVKVADQPVSLTPKEFDVLTVLAEGNGRLCTRTSILERVWGTPWHGSVRTVDLHVAALRRKLNCIESSVRIETVRGLGFRLTRPNQHGL